MISCGGIVTLVLLLWLCNVQHYVYAIYIAYQTFQSLIYSILCSILRKMPPRSSILCVGLFDVSRLQLNEIEQNISSATSSHQISNKNFGSKQICMESFAKIYRLQSTFNCRSHNSCIKIKAHNIWSQRVVTTNYVCMCVKKKFFNFLLFRAGKQGSPWSSK